MLAIRCDGSLWQRKTGGATACGLVAYSSDDVFLTQLIRVGEGMNILGLMIGFTVLALLSASLFAFFLAKQSD